MKYILVIDHILTGGAEKILIDATEGISDQDKKISSIITEAGKGLIVAINKWDLIEDKKSNTRKAKLKEDQDNVEEDNDFPMSFDDESVIKALPCLDININDIVEVKSVKNSHLKIAHITKNCKDCEKRTKFIGI